MTKLKIANNKGCNIDTVDATLFHVKINDKRFNFAYHSDLQLFDHCAVTHIKSGKRVTFFYCPHFGFESKSETTKSAIEAVNKLVERVGFDKFNKVLIEAERNA